MLLLQRRIRKTDAQLCLFDCLYDLFYSDPSSVQKLRKFCILQNLNKDEEQQSNHKQLTFKTIVDIDCIMFHKAS